MNFSNFRKSIKRDVSKAFDCEVISTAVYDSIINATLMHKLPEFDDIECKCQKDDMTACCNVSADYINARMRGLGVIEKCREFIAPCVDDEGEWR